MINDSILPILTTSLIQFSLEGLGECIPNLTALSSFLTTSTSCLMSPRSCAALPCASAVFWSVAASRRSVCRNSSSVSSCFVWIDDIASPSRSSFSSTSGLKQCAKTTKRSLSVVTLHQGLHRVKMRKLKCTLIREHEVAGKWFGWNSLDGMHQNDFGKNVSFNLSMC